MMRLPRHQTRLAGATAKRVGHCRARPLFSKFMSLNRNLDMGIQSMERVLAL